MNVFRVYAMDAERYEKLTDQEETLLLLQMQNGREARHLSQSTYEEAKKARSKLIECNLRLVTGIAKKFFDTHVKFFRAMRSVDLMDLIGFGYMGLIYAVDNWRFGRGSNKLSTLAVRCIYQAIVKNCLQWSKRDKATFDLDNLDQDSIICRGNQMTTLNERRRILAGVLQLRPQEAFVILTYFNLIDDCVPEDRMVLEQLDTRVADTLGEKYFSQRWEALKPEKKKSLRAIGQVLGISKAKAGKIEIEAKNKLRNLITAQT